MLREGRAERRSQAGAQTSNRRIRDQPLSRPHAAFGAPALGGAGGGRLTHVRAGVPERGADHPAVEDQPGLLFPFLFFDAIEV